MNYETRRLLERLGGEYLHRHLGEMVRLARQGYAEHGRGVIRIEADGDRYAPLPDDWEDDEGKLTSLLAEYDPAHEFIALIGAGYPGMFSGVVIPVEFESVDESAKHLGAFLSGMDVEKALEADRNRRAREVDLLTEAERDEASAEERRSQD